MRALVAVVRTCLFLLFLVLSAKAEAQAAPPPNTYPPPTVYGQAPPYALPPPPFDVERSWQKPKRVRGAYRALPWRLLLEIGGSGPWGSAAPAVDGHSISGPNAVGDADELLGVFDLRFSVQRLIGEWFGLGLQLGLASWQGEYLNNLRHKRSEYVSLALVPEARIRFGSTCRRCVYMVFGGRVGALLSIPGEYARDGFGYADAKLGPGWLWGLQMGLELRFSERVGARVLGGYEGAHVYNDVDYGRWGSERMSFKLSRGVMSFALVVGIL